MAVRWKRVGIIAASVVGVLLVVVIGLVLFLQSQMFITKVLPKVQKYAAENFGIESSFEHAEFSIFKHVLIRNAHIAMKKPDGLDVDMKLKELHVRFALMGLLHGEMEVAEVRVIEPTLRAKLPYKPEEIKTDEPNPPNPIKLVKDLIEKPPVRLDVSAVTIQNIRADIVQFYAPGASRTIHIDGMSFETSLLLEQNRLATGLEVTTIENGAPIQFKQKGMNVSLGLPVAQKVALEFVNRNGKWTLSFPEFDVQSGFKNLAAKITQPGMRVELNWPSGTFSLAPTPELSFDMTNIMAMSELSKPEFEQRMPAEVEALIKTLNLNLGMAFESEFANLAVKQVDKTTKTNREIKTDFKALFKPKIVIKDGESFDIELDPTTTAFELKGLTFAQTAPGASQNVTLGLLAATPKLKFPFRKADLKEPPNVLVKNLDLDAGLKIQDLGLISKSAPKQTFGKKQPPPEPVIVDVKNIAVQTKINGNDNGRLSIRNEGNIELKESDDIVWNVFLRDEDKKFDIDVSASLKPRANWLKSPSLAKVEDAGKLDIKTSLKGAFVHMMPSVANVDPKNQNAWAFKADYSVSVAQQKLEKQPLSFFWPKPLTVNGGLSWNPRQTQIQTKVLLPEISAMAKAVVKSLDIDSSVVVNTVNFKPTKAVVKARTKIGDVIVSEPKASVKDIDVVADVNVAIVNMQPTNATVVVNTKIADVIADVAKASIKGISASTTVNASLKNSKPTGVEVSIHSSVDSVKMHDRQPITPVIERYAKGVEADVVVWTDAVNVVKLRQLAVKTNAGLTEMNMTGESDLKGSTLQFEGVGSVGLPGIVPMADGTEAKATGRVSVPWKLTRNRGNQFNLDGRMRFFNVAAEAKKAFVRDLNGGFAFSQELELLEVPVKKEVVKKDVVLNAEDSKKQDFKVRWTYEINDNPFRRVDAVRIRPFLDDESQVIRITEMGFENKKVGPFRARVSLGQNLMQIENMDLSLFDGIYTGQSFIDLRPQRFRLGFLGRVTNIDIDLMNNRPSNPGQDNRLSARMATVFELERSSLEGRIDVTKIGQKQLLGLVDVLDPESRDSQLNKARLGLQVSYPTYVGIRMEQGLMDVTINLAGALKTQIDARQLPLGSLMAPYTREVKNLLKEVPLQ